jgi:hypothetical protein
MKELNCSRSAAEFIPRFATRKLVASAFAASSRQVFAYVSAWLTGVVVVKRYRTLTGQARFEQGHFHQTPLLRPRSEKYMHLPPCESVPGLCDEPTRTSWCVEMERLFLNLTRR